MYADVKECRPHKGKETESASSRQIDKEQKQEAAHQKAIAKNQSTSLSVHDVLSNVLKFAKQAIIREPAKEADTSSPKSKKLCTQNDAELSHSPTDRVANFETENNAASSDEPVSVERPPLAEIDSNADAGNNAASDESTSIELPLPVNQIYHMYTPAEAVNVYLKMDAEKDKICGPNKGQNKNALDAPTHQNEPLQ
jgi:hypothetical protein